MADIETRLDINVDTSNALANIKALQRQISALHQEISRGGAQANAKAFGLQQNFINSLNASGKFAASIDNIATSTESFTTALEKNKLSMGQYFKYAGGASKSFGKFFKTEMDTITRVAVERVKDLQTQYVKMGRDANGALQAIKVRPLTLDMNDLATKTAIAAQKQQLLNQLLKQGSTAMLNWGKNTQWAGRQLMVGFTIPLGILGSTAAKVFMEMEKQAIAFKRVYGDSFTATAETDAMLKQVQDLSLEFTKYGVAVSDTMGLAAKAAAMGKKGADLLAQTTQANRLAVLGQIDQQQALDTTISLTNAFGTTADKLAGKIDFLNAVENQTVTSIEDLTIAIPKAGPVVQQLGGNVEDLAFFLTAMKEGGINASEGANALKSGLASIINPTAKASKMLQGMGINLNAIVQGNKGDVKKTVIDFADALNKLDPLKRAQAIEQLFGKFQFARISTLFQNVTAQGTQAQKVLELTKMTTSDLAKISSQELGKIEESPMFKFQKAIETFKAQLAPVGEEFLKAVTPIIDFGTNILNSFNKLDAGTKQFIVGLTGLLAGVGPVLLMTFGLLANGAANIIKGFTFVKNVFNKTTTASTTLGETTNYLTTEQIKAASVAASLDQVHNKLTQSFTSEAASINLLIREYEKLILAQGATPVTGNRGVPPVRRANGGMIRGPGSGTSDSIPAMLSNGEFVVSAKRTKQYGPLLGMIAAGKVPGYASDEAGGSLVDLSPTEISNAKKEAGLFKAPAAVRKQTMGFDWDTRMAEIKAAESAASSAGASEYQIGNLGQRQASHIVPDVSSVNVGNIFVQVKNWLAKNLVPDLGYVNNYLNAIQQSSTILTNFNATHIDRVAKELGISVEEVRQITDRFAKGIHPTTRKEAEVLRQIAMSDSGYQGKAAAAGLTERLRGNYYETMESRRYDPSKDKSAAKTTMSRLKLFARKIFGTGKQSLPEHTSNIIIDEVSGRVAAADDAIVEGVRKKTRTKSPSVEADNVGKDIGQGFLNGAESKVDDAKKAGEEIGDAVAGGARRRGRRATGGGGPATSTQSYDFTPPTPGSRSRGRRAIRQGDLEARNLEEQLMLSQAMAQRSQQRQDYIQASRQNPELYKQRKAQLKEKMGASRYRKMGLSRVANAKVGLGGGAASMGVSMVAGMATMIPGMPQEVSGILSTISAVAGGFSLLAPILSKFGLTFGKLIPGLGIAIAAFEAFNLISGMYNDAKKKEMDAASRLTTAMESSAKAASAYGEIVKSKFSEQIQVGSVSVTTSGPIAYNNGADAIANSESFKNNPEIQKNIEDISKMSDETAQSVLERIARQQLSAGAEAGAVQDLIDAIKGKAGKKTLKIEVSGLDLSTTSGQENIGKTSGSTVQGLMSDNQWGTGVMTRTYTTEASQTGGGGRTVTENMGGKSFTDMYNSSDTLKAKVKGAAQGIISDLNSVNYSFKNGLIDSNAYKAGLAKIFDPITKSGDPEKASILVGQMFNELGDQKLTDAANSITDIGDKITFMEAILSGYSPDQGLINELANGTATQRAIANAQLLAGATAALTPTTTNADGTKTYTGDVAKYTPDTTTNGGVSEQDKLNAALTLIGQKEAKINKKYDERKKALESMAEIQKSITEQQQEQLDIASALSRGDVAAAARAAQQMRANNAKRSLDQQQKQLEASRQIELGNVRDPLGRSRSQIQRKLDKIAEKDARNTMKGIGSGGGGGGGTPTKTKKEPDVALGAGWHYKKKGGYYLLDKNGNYIPEEDKAQTTTTTTTDSGTSPTGGAMSVPFARKSYQTSQFGTKIPDFVPPKFSTYEKTVSTGTTAVKAAVSQIRQGDKVTNVYNFNGIQYRNENDLLKALIEKEKKNEKQGTRTINGRV